MNTTLSSALKHNQNVRIQSPVVREYWASVTRCVARPDGSGEIVHADGRVERFNAEGRPIPTRHQARADGRRSHDEDVCCHAIAA
jgi:hypothetical protein